MDIEACLTILADRHHRYLWRQDGTGHGEKGEKGWGFVTSQRGVSTGNIHPTIAEAIAAEIDDLGESVVLAKNRVTNEVEQAKELEQRQAELLTAFGRVD